MEFVHPEKVINVRNTSFIMYNFAWTKVRCGSNLTSNLTNNVFYYKMKINKCSFAPASETVHGLDIVFKDCYSRQELQQEQVETFPYAGIPRWLHCCLSTKTSKDSHGYLLLHDKYFCKTSINSARADNHFIALHIAFFWQSRATPTKNSQ